MPTKGLSYKDAARILGGDGSAVLASLDKLAGGMLLIATAGGSEIALSLFDAKSEFINLSETLWGSLADRVRGLGRFDKAERISAAHAVIVISSYFETI